jgi:hypothetical protein
MHTNLSEICGHHGCEYENDSALMGFWTLSIVRYSKEHNVSETGSVSVLR